MAIGDSFSVTLGTATANRQPSSGVFEELSAIVKSGGTDLVAMYDGTNEFQLLTNSGTTNALVSGGTSMNQAFLNMAIKIGNAVYVRKAGTTDRISISGVQVDA